MPVPEITLYLDTVSPFAYIAFHILRNSPAFAKCNVNYVPIFLGGLMNACNNTPPIQVKNKDQWIGKERLRWSKQFSVPIADKMPDGFPVLTLGVQRALVAVSQKAPAKLPTVMEALFRSLWVDLNSNIGKPEGFVPVFEGVLGKEATQEILQASTQPEVKALLLSNTDHAFKIGAFGLPWFECTDANGNTEGFWGVDHLGQVAQFLGLDRGVDSGFKALL